MFDLLRLYFGRNPLNNMFLTIGSPRDVPLGGGGGGAGGGGGWLGTILGKLSNGATSLLSGGSPVANALNLASSAMSFLHTRRLGREQRREGIKQFEEYQRRQGELDYDIPQEVFDIYKQAQLSAGGTNPLLRAYQNRLNEEGARDVARAKTGTTSSAVLNALARVSSLKEGSATNRAFEQAYADKVRRERELREAGYKVADEKHRKFQYGKERIEDLRDIGLSMKEAGSQNLANAYGALGGFFGGLSQNKILSDYYKGN